MREGTISPTSYNNTVRVDRVSTEVAIQFNCNVGGGLWRVDMNLQSIIYKRVSGGFVATERRHTERHTYTALHIDPVRTDEHNLRRSFTLHILSISMLELVKVCRVSAS